MIKEIKNKIKGLWHSNRKDFGGKSLLWMALFMFVIDIILSLNLLFVTDMISYIVLLYFLIALGLLVILLIVTYFYIYGKSNSDKKVNRCILGFYMIFLVITFIVFIPIFIFLKITEYMLNYRAKKFDNLTNFLLILVGDVLIVCCFLYLDILVSEIFSGLINVFVNTSGNIEVDIYAVKIFFVLVLIKMEIDLFNFMILKLMNHFGMNKVNKKVNLKLREYYNFNLDLDIKEYFEDRENRIKDFQDNEENKLAYDLAYQKKTLWKFQLLCLIVLFFVAAFVPDIIFINSSAAVNVITFFTLIILYLDKRKEWK